MNQQTVMVNGKRRYYRVNPIPSTVQTNQRIDALNEYAKLINDVLAIEGYSYNGIKQNAETLTQSVDVLPTNQ
jgi:hypothetical protein